MDIAFELHKLITRFELCVSKFDPAVHKFKFGISYVQDEIQQILQQIDTKDFFAHSANMKLRSLNAYINDIEMMLNISSTSKDIVIDDNEPKLIKPEIFDASVTMANGDILFYNSGPVAIDGINWSVPNHAYKTKDEVIDDNYTYPATLTYGIKAINDVADVTIKTLFNEQPTNHKDIVTLKISKPNNDTVIE